MSTSTLNGHAAANGHVSRINGHAAVTAPVQIVCVVETVVERDPFRRKAAAMQREIAHAKSRINLLDQLCQLYEGRPGDVSRQSTIAGIRYREQAQVVELEQERERLLSTLILDDAVTAQIGPPRVDPTTAHEGAWTPADSLDQETSDIVVPVYASDAGKPAEDQQEDGERFDGQG